jgi:hypothetical protein
MQFLSTTLFLPAVFCAGISEYKEGGVEDALHHATKDHRDRKARENIPHEVRKVLKEHEDHPIKVQLILWSNRPKMIGV